jgi:hypothetical protein
MVVSRRMTTARKEVSMTAQLGRDLGPLITRIAGPQFYDAQAAPGEEIYLERDPDNRHDPNAFRLENLDFEPIGHLPRRIASWLAPLVDRGRLLPKAVATGSASPAVDLSLTLHVTSRGRRILHRRRKPRNAEEALHNLILQAFRDASGQDSPEFVAGLASHLRRLQSRHILPKSRMLLDLLPGLARQAGIPDLQSALRAMHPGDSQILGGLTLFPVLPRNGSRSVPAIRLLATALEDGTAEVRELDGGGSVPSLLLCNNGDLPLLAPEGEILVGAKQNRMLQFTVLAPAHEQIEVPVCCVEQGRWAWSSSSFAMDAYAPPVLRQAVQSSRQESGGADTQHCAWQAVESYLDDLAVESSTQTVTDGLAEARRRRGGESSLPELPASTLGVLATQGSEVLALDLFASQEIFQSQWPRLAEGYLSGSRESKTPGPSSSELATSLLEHLAEAAKPASEQTGLGTRFDIRSPHAAGAALWFEGSIHHLAALGPAASTS